MKERLRKLEEERGLKGKDTLAERFLRSAQRLRAVYRGEQLPPEHPDGDYFDIRSVAHQREEREEVAGGEHKTKA